MKAKEAIFKTMKTLSILLVTICIFSMLFTGGGASSLGAAIIVFSGCSATLASIATLVLDPRPVISWKWTTAIILFLIWIWISVLQAAYQNEAILWASIWTAVLGLSLSIHYLGAGRKTRGYFLWVFVLCVAAAIGIGIADEQGWQHPWLKLVMSNPENSSITGPYYNSSHFSGFLILGTAVLLGTLFFHRFTLWSIVVLFLVVLLQWINLKTDSSSIPVVIAMVPIMLLMWIIHKNWKVGLTLAALSAAVGIWSAAMFISPEGQTWFKQNQARIGLVNSWPSFVEGRIGVWNYAERIWNDRPSTGAGIGQFAVLSSSYRRDPRVTGSSVDRQFVNYTHNDILQIGSELGWVGVVLFMGLMIYTFLQGLKYRSAVNMMAAATIVGYMLTGTYDSHITAIPATMLVFYALLGLSHAPHTNNLMVDSGTNSRNPTLTDL